MEKLKELQKLAKNSSKIPETDFSKEWNKSFAAMRAFAEFYQRPKDIEIIRDYGFIVEEEIAELSVEDQEVVRGGWTNHSNVMKQLSDLYINIHELYKTYNKSDEKNQKNSKSLWEKNGFKTNEKFLKTLQKIPIFQLDVIKMKKSLEFLWIKCENQEILHPILDVVERLQCLQIARIPRDPLLVEKTKKVYELADAYVSVAQFLDGTKKKLKMEKIEDVGQFVNAIDEKIEEIEKIEKEKQIGIQQNKKEKEKIEEEKKVKMEDQQIQMVREDVEKEKPIQIVVEKRKEQKSEETENVRMKKDDWSVIPVVFIFLIVSITITIRSLIRISRKLQKQAQKDRKQKDHSGGRPCYRHKR